MDVKQRFATRLKQLREEKGLSQAQLGEMIGVSRGSISYYENQSRIPDIEILEEFAKFFHVSSDWLLGLSDVKNPDISVKAINGMTGLSEESIEVLCLFQDYFNGNELIKTVNFLLEQEMPSPMTLHFDFPVPDDCDDPTEYENQMLQQLKEDEEKFNQKGLIPLLSRIETFFEMVYDDENITITESGNIISDSMKESVKKRWKDLFIAKRVSKKEVVETVLLSDISDKIKKLDVKWKAKNKEA